MVHRLEQGGDVVDGEQGARMAHRELSGSNAGAHLLGQTQQAKVIGDRRAVLADRDGNLLLRQSRLVAEPLVGLRFLDGIEVLALDVLDQRGLEEFLVADLGDVDRQLQQAGDLRCPPAALAGDDLEALALAAHDDRLHQARAADRLGQFLQLHVVEASSRLQRVGVDQVEIYLPLWLSGFYDSYRSGNRRGRFFGDEGAEPSPEGRTTFRFLCHGVSGLRGSSATRRRAIAGQEFMERAT